MSGKSNTIKAVKIRPAFYKIEGYRGAWVELRELATCIGLPAREVWSKYFSLSKDYEEHGILATIPMKTGILVKLDVNGCHLEADLADFILHGDIFVPAGWAIDVLAAHKAGTPASDNNSSPDQAQEDEESEDPSSDEADVIHLKKLIHQVVEELTAARKLGLAVGNSSLRPGTNMDKKTSSEIEKAWLDWRTKFHESVELEEKIELQVV